MYYEKSKEQTYYERNQMKMVCLDDCVPKDHLFRLIDKAVDFSFIHKLTKDFYCQDNGRNCIDTITLFKIPLLNYLKGNNSIRATLKEAEVNMADRWFLNVGLDSKIPNYSTFSQNYKRHFKDSDIFEKIFTSILTQIIEKGLIDESVIFVDGTHIKANANKHKRIKRQVKCIADKYHNELNKEVDEFRDINGRNHYHDDDFKIDDKTGEVIEKPVDDTKIITESITDPDSGMFVKGEHERQFAYVDQVACDANCWILGYSVNKGSMHDSRAFLPFFEKKLLKFHPDTICCDAGYANALIAKNVQEKNINFLAPYVRPRGRKQKMSKRDFDYYFEIDRYMCPNRKILVPWNITKDGYIEYKIHKDECGDCPYKKDCLKGYAFKTIRRHLYDDCMDKAKRYRLSPEGKVTYKIRKETIERVFALGKEKYGLRYTRYKGLEKNKNYRALLYACMNIKKLALLMKRRVKKQENMSYSY